MVDGACLTIVVACRTPCIGIGGSILCGGFSWLSAEYGLTSDPQNLLDAQVVKLDGQVVWAAEEEPDLLWALRGAGGSFGGTSVFYRPIRLPQILCFSPTEARLEVANAPTYSRDSFQAASLPLHAVDICRSNLSPKEVAARNCARSCRLHAALARRKTRHVSLCAQKATLAINRYIAGHARRTCF